MRTSTASLVGILLLAFAGHAQASVDVGWVQFSVGDTRAENAAGTERILRKGDPVHEGDTVITGAGASMQLRMVDNAVIAIRPESQVQIDTYRFHGENPGAHRAVLRLIRGALRSITGLIGHTNKDNYQIITDRATIGVRGTDHEPFHLPAGAAQTGGRAGTYDKVNTGATYLAAAGGRVNLAPNQVGFVGNEPESVPTRLAGVPDFMRVTPAVPAGGASIASDEPVALAARDAVATGAEPAESPPAAAPDFQPVISKRSRDGTVDFTAGAFSGNGNQVVAGVYGDRSGGVARQAAFTAQRVPAEKFLAGTSAALAATDPASKLIYTRGPAPQVAAGAGSFADNGTTVAVNWGLYGTGASVNGHAVRDQFTGGAGRRPDYFFAMGALEAPAAVVSGLSGTYSGLVASTPVIAETGTPSGSVTNATIVLASGALTQYQIGVTDGLSRTWAAQCATCASGVSLATFKAAGVPLSGTGPTGTATGQASGAPVGPTGQGIISAFALKDGPASVTGAFAVTK